jgi:hypothetical protein
MGSGGIFVETPLKPHGQLPQYLEMVDDPDPDKFVLLENTFS